MLRSSKVTPLDTMFWSRLWLAGSISRGRKLESNKMDNGPRYSSLLGFYDYGGRPCPANLYHPLTIVVLVYNLFLILFFESTFHSIDESTILAPFSCH